MRPRRREADHAKPAASSLPPPVPGAADALAWKFPWTLTGALLRQATLRGQRFVAQHGLAWTLAKGSGLPWSLAQSSGISNCLSKSRGLAGSLAKGSGLPRSLSKS